MKKYILLFLLVSCSSNSINDKLSKSLFEMEERLQNQELENQKLLNRIETFEYEQERKNQQFEESNNVNFNTINLVVQKQSEQEKFNVEFLNILKTHDDKITKIGTKVPKLDNDTDYRASLKLGIKLYNKGKFEEALKVFKGLEQTKKHPSDDLYKILTYNLALTEYKVKDYINSGKRFQEILLDNNNKKNEEKYIPSVLFHLGMIYNIHGDCYSSKILFDRLKKDFPKHFLNTKIPYDACPKA